MDTINLYTHPKRIQQQAIKLLSEALPEHLLRHFDHGEVRYKTLVLHFKHPGAVQEFGLQRDAILEKMRKIYGERKLKEKIVFEHVEAECHFHLPEKPPPEKALPFEERADGNFTNNVTSPKLHAMFEQIRHTIKERKQ